MKMITGCHRGIEYSFPKRDAFFRGLDMEAEYKAAIDLELAAQTALVKHRRKMIWFAYTSRKKK